VTLVDKGIEEINPDPGADLIGIRAVTGTTPRAYELTDHFRWPGIPVVRGKVKHCENHLHSPKYVG